MKSLIFIVEGETELAFIDRLLIPYLREDRNLNTRMQGLMIKKSGGGHGYSNIDHFKNTINLFLRKENKPIITTMFDHYGLNSEAKLPGYTECLQIEDVEAKLAKMEEKLSDVVNNIQPYRHFIPYIQRHEFETLLFANPSEGFALEDDRIKNDILQLCSQHNIEDINTTPQGAPSRRLKAIYTKYRQKYEKGADAVDIAELTTFASILIACPRFRRWVDKLEYALLHTPE